MSTLYLRVPDEITTWIHEEAKARDMKISAFVIKILRKQYKKSLAIRLEEETKEDA